MRQRLPETHPDAPRLARPRRTPSSPVSTVLMAAWVIAVLGATASLLVAYGQSGTLDYFTPGEKATVPLGIARACLTAAFFAGIAHLTVAATRWSPRR